MIENRYLLLDTSLWAEGREPHCQARPRVQGGPKPALRRRSAPGRSATTISTPTSSSTRPTASINAGTNPFIIDVATSDTPPAQRQPGAYRAALAEAHAAEHIRKHREMGVCYAVSSDGIHWDRPELGLIEFNGSTRNNLVMRDVHGVGVTLDPHDPDPAGRFKAFMEGGVARSPDGLHWSPLQPCPEIDARWDTHNNLFWDEGNGRYVGITRLWDGRQRTVGRTESVDFNSWTRAVEVLQALPNEPDRQTYALIAFPYAQLYLGLLMMFDTATDLRRLRVGLEPGHRAMAARRTGGRR